jgi:hypothetical protein
VFTELDDNAYVDFEHDAIAQESDVEQDLDIARFRELATKEARQLAADHIHTLASHRCHNHSNALTGEEAYFRPKSLWDAAQYTDSLLRIVPRMSNGSTTLCHRPLKSQKLPHIDQYANIEWEKLYGVKDHRSHSRGQLSFKLSQEEAFRRLGGRVTLKRRWDVDSVMFRATTLGVFNEGAELCFYPPFDRSIKQDPNVTFNSCKIHDCKNHLLAYGGSSMIRWDCHLVTPNVPKTSRFDTRQFSHQQLAFWTDKILLPAIRIACDSDKTNHLPRSFEEVRTRSLARGETTVANHYQRAGPTEGSTETVGLGLSRVGKHSSIGCYLQQEDLQEVWKEVVAIIRLGLASESDAMFKDFKDCFLVVSSHGTKMATKGRDHTLGSTRAQFTSMFDRAFDTRLEIIPREDFYVDSGHEITPERASGLVLLRKTGCLEHLKTSYACQVSASQKVAQDNWKWAMTEAAGTTKIVPSKTNSLRLGGLADIKAYNLNKDIFVGMDRTLAPFSEDKLEGLAFDPDVLNQWLEHNRQGSSQHGGAGPRTRETLLNIMRQIKRRLDNALESSKEEPFGVRAEERVNIKLYDILQEPDSTWLQEITVEDAEQNHLPFWILPADHVEAYWRSEIDRWLFGFERQITTVSLKNHGIDGHQQFINSATATIFLRTLKNITSLGSTGRPLQLWRAKYKTKETKRSKPLTRYGLGFEDSLKAWGMPFIDADLLSWEVLAIKPSKLAKTAFFHSFGFELGFKRKVSEFGTSATKASGKQIRRNLEDKCLREYFQSLMALPGSHQLIADLRTTKFKIYDCSKTLRNATARGDRRTIKVSERQKADAYTAMNAQRKLVADHFRDGLMLPTELVIQQYIRDVFRTLRGSKGSNSRASVAGLKNLQPDVRDGRRGLTWLTFAHAFSDPEKLNAFPDIIESRDEATNSHSGGKEKTVANAYPYDWKGRMDALFRIKDDVKRGSWNVEIYRRKTRDIYAMMRSVMTPDVAEIWESELGEAACRYLWAVPSFNSSNFSVLGPKSGSNNPQTQSPLETARDVGYRTKIIVPRIGPNKDCKFSKDDSSSAEVLARLMTLIPRRRSVIPNAGFEDNEIVRLIKKIYLNTLGEATQMKDDLKLFLLEAHQCLQLIKPGTKGNVLPMILMADTAKGSSSQTARDGGKLLGLSIFPKGQSLGQLPLVPVFEDVMSLQELDAFYSLVQEAIDKDQEENEEQDQSTSESESESESELELELNSNVGS